MILLSVSFTTFVAWSRMYRGMHHLTDVIAGVVLGLGAIVVLVFAVRRRRAARRRTRRDTGRSGRDEAPAERIGAAA